MTNFVSGYNFMDLLKDKGIAPQTDVKITRIISIFNEIAARLSSKIEHSAEPHDFMDLLHDKGVVPSYSNDNAVNEQVA